MINEAKIYQAFYTKSTPIVDYMVEKLCLKPNDLIFEPCGGDGVFVEAILAQNEFAKIDVCELNPLSTTTLAYKFQQYESVNVRECDTLLDNELSFNTNFGGYYDKIIANPPYGAWQDVKKRAILKKMYPDLYTKESYALFLFRCIELLKDGGILTFIIPDTFLNLHSHQNIRKYILTNTKIVELALFPSSFFPGVNFGYANLSIITLKKTFQKKQCLANSFKILTGFSSVNQLSDNQDNKIKIQVYNQEKILLNVDHAFFISDNTNISTLINKAEYTVGSIANCVTGFYSGNDKQFLQVNSFDLKNAKNYQLISEENINRSYHNIPDLLDGIADKTYFLPIVKGGNTKYLKPEGWFMNWSKEAVQHYKKDKKARYQNAQYYFKFGIGVPMISSSSITASLIENKLFDQSIVGVFPKDESLTYYLLAFLNSTTCNKLIRTINPSANNPANYIKKIPFLPPNNNQKKRVTAMVQQILEGIALQGNYDLSIEKDLNSIFEQQYGF